MEKTISVADDINRDNRRATILSHMKSDYRQSLQAKEANDAKRRGYLDAYNGVLYGNEHDNSSKAISKDIQSMLKWQIPSLMAPFVEDDKIAQMNPVTAEDEEITAKHQPIVNIQFCREFDRFNFVRKLVNNYAKEGMAIVKESWLLKTTKHKFEVEETDYDELDRPIGSRIEVVEKEKIIQNRPDGLVVDNNDIYLDPTNNGSFKDSKFIIERIHTNVSTLIMNKDKYFNIDKVIAKVKEQEGNVNTNTEPDATTVDNPDLDYSREFKFEDIARKQLVAYEYWGQYDIHGTGVTVPMVGTWYEDILIRLQDNPMPGQATPYHMAGMDEIKNSPYFAPDFASIMDDQQNRTALLRGMIDSVSNSNFGQKGVPTSFLDTANKKRFFRGLNFEYNGKDPGNIFVDQHNPLSTTTFQFFQSLSDTMEAKTGIKSFSGGMNTGSLDGSATAAKGTLTAAEMRKVYHIRNIAENVIKPMIRHWVNMNEEFLTPEDVFRYTNREFEKVYDDDRIGTIDMDIKVSTPEMDNIKAQELAFMMQTLGQNMTFERNKLITSKIAELRNMPGLARDIMNEQQPEPTEMEIQMQQIAIEKAQLENDMIKADISYRRSAVLENGADFELKTAKAQEITESANSKRVDTDMVKNGLKFQMERTADEHSSQLRREEKAQDNTTAGVGLRKS